MYIKAQSWKILGSYNPIGSVVSVLVRVGISMSLQYSIFRCMATGLKAPFVSFGVTPELTTMKLALCLADTMPLEQVQVERTRVMFSQERDTKDVFFG